MLFHILVFQLTIFPQEIAIVIAVCAEVNLNECELPDNPKDENFTLRMFSVNVIFLLY
jgi:hypothetical protein